MALATAIFLFVSLGFSGIFQQKAVGQSEERGETIVMLRHGEKPDEHPQGQLDCRGLNRALALPAVLAKYGHPLAIFAPNPSIETTDGNVMPFAREYSYVRPLATIEPYAISLDTPVNTQIGTKDIHDLEEELISPRYANGTVMVAWEHIEARKFAEDLIRRFGLEHNAAPNWKNSDFDTIYVFHLTPPRRGKQHLDFHIEHENLNNMPTTCPVVLLPSKR